MLGPFVLHLKNVLWRSHFSLPFVLDEDREWLEKNKALYDFVDPEIGHMAKSALDLNIQYGYLYIISDNPAHKYTHDLLNERSSTVVEDRKARLMEIDEVLRSFFLAWEKY